MTNINPKKKMKIAMVGVSPADQITFKGYLRVLLRLDVDLDWVSAQAGEVDLYVINEDFKHSASVQKLVDIHSRTPILYVSRNLTGEGGISGNSLVLPLKQINALNDWLHHNVIILKGLPYQSVSSSSSTLAVTNQNQPASHEESLTQASVKSVKPTQSKDVKPARYDKLGDVIEMVETLHAHPHSLFELLQNGEVFAVIDGARRLVWPKSTKAANIDTWRLRVYGGAVDESQEAWNLNQWLYHIGWTNADKLLPLFNQEACYQLSSEVAAMKDVDERIHQVMTALQSKCTLDEIVSRTSLSRLLIQKVIVSLLFAQYLTAVSYQDIGINTTMPTIEDDQKDTHDIARPSSPTSSQGQEAEPLSFLARLQRKLRGS